MPLATILGVFGLRRLSDVQRARARAASGEAYRQVADKATSAQLETAAVLASLLGASSDIGNRVVEVEQMLKAIG